jgi:hypothetical protein
MLRTINFLTIIEIVLQTQDIQTKQDINTPLPFSHFSIFPMLIEPNVIEDNTV